LSKKQLKRKAAALERKSEQIEPYKERQKLETLRKQMDSPEAKAFIEELETDLSEAMDSLLRPSGTSKQPSFGLIESQKESKEDMYLQSADRVTPESKTSDRRLIPSSSNEIRSTDLEDSLSLHKQTSTRALDICEETEYHLGKGEVNEAMELILKTHSQGQQLGTRVWNRLLSALVKGRNYEEVDTVFTAFMNMGYEPDSYTWCTLVDSRVRAGRLDGQNGAIAVVERLQRLGLTPTSEMCSSILSGLVRAKRYEQADNYWIQLKVSGVKPNKQMFTTMIMLCARRKVTSLFCLPHTRSQSCSCPFYISHILPTLGHT
jgi:pentatricopeptide repeat protein